MTHTPMRISCVAVFLLGTATGVGAQEGSAIPTGSRIRITPIDPAAAVRVGSAQPSRNDTIALQTNAGTFTIAQSAVRGIEISRGRRSSFTASALGFVAGAAVGGFALGCLANRDDYGVLCGGQHDTRLVVGVALGGLLGAFLGHSLSRRERWEAIRWP